MFGLLAEKTGIAAKLKSFGITREDARSEVVKIIGRVKGGVREDIPYTPRAKFVVDFALDEGNRQGMNLFFALNCD
ncbi:hypothetical protein M5689_018099 [Euphorbia peplus]|nr:hypothetical protein M5689_018099 [Euphorbia peplus]